MISWDFQKVDFFFFHFLKCSAFTIFFPSASVLREKCREVFLSFSILRFFAYFSKPVDWLTDWLNIISWPFETFTVIAFPDWIEKKEFWFLFDYLVYVKGTMNLFVSQEKWSPNLIESKFNLIKFIGFLSFFSKLLSFMNPFFYLHFKFLCLFAIMVELFAF